MKMDLKEMRGRGGLNLCSSDRYQWKAVVKMAMNL
jgi:hypothetical protein